MDVARLREQFPVCKKMVYMNTGWSGPSPLSVTEAMKSRLDLEMEEGPTTKEVYESGREIQSRAREAAAGLLNASVEEVCLTDNTTHGLNIAINGLDWQEGDEIITCDLEHSSVLVPSYFQQRHHGAVVKVLPIATNETQDGILSKIEAAIAVRTRLVFLSHIEYSCGLRMPAKEIRHLLKGRGILIMLDGAQTAGHIALDMKDMDCDFYAIPAQKWLLGPEGAGALYMRKELIPQVEPVHVSSRSSLSSNDPYRFEPNTDSIDKFLLTSSSYALRAGMLEAIRFVQEVGVGEIERRNLALATSMNHALQEIPGVKVLSPLEEEGSSGLVTFTIDGVDPAAAVSRMWEEHRIVCRPVSYPASIRFSLHFFNTEEEVGAAVEAVRGLA
jgi:L-cysteine/cystine lyase